MADKEQAGKERACNEWEKMQKLMQMAEDKLVDTARVCTCKERADKERADKERADKERADKERADKDTVRVCRCTAREAQLALQGRIRSIFLIGSKL